MLIVLEGLDGAGKSTQVELVRRMFAQEGVESHFLHFPRFDAPVYGELIARFLRGELGAVDKVDPYLVALLFAGDRADAAAQLRCWLDAGHAVVLDRYVYSNVGFQCAKLPAGGAGGGGGGGGGPPPYFLSVSMMADKESSKETFVSIAC